MQRQFQTNLPEFQLEGSLQLQIGSHTCNTWLSAMACSGYAGVEFPAAGTLNAITASAHVRLAWDTDSIDAAPGCR